MAHPQKVLLVEDNLDNQLIYTSILEYSGFEVLAATDGPAGLEMARAARPDVILMDISIPEIDGWEVTRRLKADPETRTIPIIVLTAHALSADRARAFAEGADGYIPKPAEPRRVVEAVRKRLADPAYSVGLSELLRAN